MYTSSLLFYIFVLMNWIEKNILAFCLMFCAVSAFSQSDTTQSISDVLAESKDGYGTITINQDPRIQELVNTHVAINKANSGKVQGWRVQIYNSSGTNSRNEAQNVRKLFLSKYPDMGARRFGILYLRQSSAFGLGLLFAGRVETHYVECL